MARPALHHVRLNVADVAESVRFFGLFGFTTIVRYDSPEAVIVQLGPGGTAPGVELWYRPRHPTRPPPDFHIAIALENVPGWVQCLRSHGVPILREPFKLGHERIAFVSDPDGHAIELYEWIEEPDEGDPAGGAS